MAKIINKLFQFIMDVIIFVILLIIIFLVYRLVSVKVFHKQYADFFGYSVFEIATGSMEPTLNIKDVIIVKKYDDYKRGEIITYKDDGDMITHRIIERHDKYVITQGDANNSADFKVEKDNIVGRAIFVIPKGGVIREILMKPKVIISLVFTIVLINIFLSLKPKKTEDNDNTGKVISINVNDDIVVGDELEKDELNNHKEIEEPTNIVTAMTDLDTLFNMKPITDEVIQKELDKQNNKSIVAKPIIEEKTSNQENDTTNEELVKSNIENKFEVVDNIFDNSPIKENERIQIEKDNFEFKPVEEKTNDIDEDDDYVFRTIFNMKPIDKIAIQRELNKQKEIDAKKNKEDSKKVNFSSFNEIAKLHRDSKDKSTVKEKNSFQNLFNKANKK